MTKRALWAALTVSSLTLAACAPPGQQAVGFRDIDWPRADQALSASDNREIEVLLVRLGYMRGGADGNITKTTRQSIRTYQRDIGAPITGFVSRPLLYSLRTSAPQVTATQTSTTTKRAPTYKTASSSSTPVKKTTTTATATPTAPIQRSVTPVSDGGGGGGAAGGSGGGAWN